MFTRNLRCSCRRLPPTFSLPLRRSLATEAMIDPPPSSGSPSTSSKRTPQAMLSVSIILNRSPIITRTPTPFERAYYSYQARIRRALHNPFPYEFYFKQGSLLETRFNIEESRRERKAFGSAFGATEADSEKDAANRMAVEQLSQQEGEGEEIMPRVHPADISRDLRSLDRKGKRNIYLLLRTNENGKELWRFPQGSVEKGELLHQAAQRDLHAECGPHMDTWIVTRKPVGHYKPFMPDVTSEGPERITFFFKAHIMAGQVRLQKPISDFAWLTKQEIESRVDNHYWLGIKDMLTDY